jgi:hypothetical protein
VHDDHTNVNPPKEIEDSIGRPPILAELIEGKVLITRVANKVLLAAGIRVGLEIVSIDGMPVKDQPIQLEVSDERGAISKKSVPRSGSAPRGNRLCSGPYNSNTT